MHGEFAQNKLEESLTLKILVSSINFAPDHAGIAVYSTDFAIYLAEQGDKVSVVTGFPYYPSWKKNSEDQGIYFSKSIYKDMQIYRGYLYVPSKVTTIARIWHELTFCIFASFNFIRSGRPDSIVLFTPPFFLGLVGIFGKWVWRCPLIINIQDLPTDAALELGMIKKGMFLKIMQRIEGWIYRRADLVTTISPAMMEIVASKRVKLSKLILVPNWIDVDKAIIKYSKGEFLSQHPIAKNKITIAYAGNLGIKQGAESLVHLANEIKSNGEVHIFIIGDGADKGRITKLAEIFNLKNLTFLPLMNPREYSNMLADIDIVFIAQKKGAGNNFFPSKLLGLLAQGKPLLVAADTDSELAKVILKLGCGLVSPYEDIVGLKKNLYKYIESKDLIREIGGKGIEGVYDFDRNKILKNWRKNIQNIVEKKL